MLVFSPVSPLLYILLYSTVSLCSPLSCGICVAVAVAEWRRGSVQIVELLNSLPYNKITKQQRINLRWGYREISCHQPLFYGETIASSVRDTPLSGLYSGAESKPVKPHQVAKNKDLAP